MYEVGRWKMQENITLILDKIREADLVLTGIGEKFIPGENREKLERAYRNLAGCLEGKNYFVITTTGMSPVLLPEEIFIFFLFSTSFLQQFRYLAPLPHGQ